MDGIIVINKPAGFTSFDVVAVMKKVCNTKKVGHAGTLDPMATGVLPVLVGQGTKVQGLLQNSGKKYTAKFLLGVKTDSQDITGNVTNRQPVSVTEEEIKNAAAKFIGKIKQVPPMYSAIKKGGVRLYTLARQGVNLDLPEREVTIYDIEFLDYKNAENTVTVAVECSKGTYIRTLCHDIGETLGCGATLCALERTSACGFSIEDSITLEQAKKMAENGTLLERLIPLDALFAGYGKVVVTAPQTDRFKNGGALFLDRTDATDADDQELMRVYDPDGAFLGMAIAEKSLGELRKIRYSDIDHL